MKRDSSLLKTLLSVALFILLEIIAIVLIVNNSIVQRYRIMGSIRAAQTYFWERGENIKYYFNLRTVNESISDENDRLREQVEKYRIIVDSINSNCSIDSCSTLYSFVPAKILKNSINKQHNYIVLDKGSRDNIAPDMGVVIDNGIIGVVKSVSKNYSYVISFLNTSQSISAKISKNNVFGPMSWSGKGNTAILKEIPLHTDVVIGDTITTSGYSLLYPADIPLGTVQSVNDVDGTSLTIDVSLFAKYNSLRFVSIVVNNSKQELDSIIK